ncbi:MAG: histidine phosphatase family protein [Oscillospiraceae bacterium]|nr:histidine phosphatase family protein [Oscillospiraceae bacterium]
MKTYKLHLIRNGLTNGNLEGYYTGGMDEPLCPRGEAEIAEYRNMGIYPAADFVFSSPVSSCRRTAGLIYPEKNVIAINDLRDCCFGDFEGHTADGLKGRPEFKEWLTGGSDTKPPNGESGREFAERVTGAFIKVVDGLIKTGTVKSVLVTHGGVIMTLMAAFGLPEAPANEWMTQPGCGYTLSITPYVWMNLKKAEIMDEIAIM